MYKSSFGPQNLIMYFLDTANLTFNSLDLKFILH